jgi:hypothetical protein
MKRFLALHNDRVLGVLTGFDRMVFRGTLRNISYVNGMGKFLGHHRIRYTHFGKFAQGISERLRLHARRYAKQQGRPYKHLDSPKISKEERACEIRDRDGIKEGLICVFGCVEQCMAYEYTPRKEQKGPWLRRRIRQCLFLYFYYMDREFGLMYVRLQTWLPMDIQIGLNGREYLARRMDRAGMKYQKRDNCFTRIDDVKRAQKMLDALVKRRWAKFLNRLASRVNPHLGRRGGLGLTGYYWSIRDDEMATDVMFRDAKSLAAIYPSLVRHAVEQFGCEDVLRFLGRRTNSRFRGEVNTERKQWIEGIRVKHRVEENSIKMYDKQGSVLRIETTISKPKRFRVYRQVTRGGASTLAWVPLRKGIMDIARRAEIGRAANERYLEALGVVGEPSPTRQLLDPVSKRIQRAGRPYRALRPVEREEARLFQAVLQGGFSLQGFRNKDIRLALYGDGADEADRKRASGRVTRLLALLRSHKLIKKVSHTLYYRVTNLGHHVMSTALRLRNLDVALVGT